MTPEQREFFNAGYKAGFRAGQRKPWSAADTKTLIEWAGSDADLAEQISRSTTAVKMKRFKLRKAGVME